MDARSFTPSAEEQQREKPKRTCRHSSLRVNRSLAPVWPPVLDQDRGNKMREEGEGKGREICSVTLPDVRVLCLYLYKTLNILQSINQEEEEGGLFSLFYVMK